MKTIEVTDEMYAKLTELATEMTTQDMRCTRMPHMFQIQSSKEVICVEGSGTEIWVDCDGDELRSKEDIKYFIINNIIDNEDDIQMTAEMKYKELDELDEIEGYLIERGYNMINVTTEKEYKNTFLTAKACQEHIDKNHYHYSEPSVYLNHAWRNPEMELVSTFLCGLVGKKMHT